MFVRQKNNQSGTVSIQIVDRSRGRYKVVKTFGCSMDPLKLDILVDQANTELMRLSQPLDINFHPNFGQELAGLPQDGTVPMCLAGPELVLGKLFDDIGFNLIKDELFRHIVISRLCFPVNKLKTIDYLQLSRGVKIDAERIGLYLGRLDDRQKERVEEICCTHAKKIKRKAFKEVFCYAEWLSLDHGEEDELKTGGLIRDAKNHHLHHLLCLFVNADGEPLAYELFEGSKLHGQDIFHAIEAFKTKFRTKHLVVVADSSIFPEELAIDWQGKGVEYLLATRLRSENSTLQSEIKALKLKNGQCKEIMIDPETRLLVSYSREQAEKERSNHHKGLEKLRNSLKAGLLSRKNLNNRGYNKYLKPVGKAGVGIDLKRFRQDERRDGLKGILTNTGLNQIQIEEQFDHLCKIGKAFRISQAELQSGSMVRPQRPYMEAHISIAFCAYKISMELERILKSAGLPWTVEQTIGMAKTIWDIEEPASTSDNSSTQFIQYNEEQQQLLKLLGW